MYWRRIGLGLLFSFVLVLGVFGCASKPAGGVVSKEASACFDLRSMHEYALAAHVDYRGWTPEVAARVAERFLAAIDPYELFLTDGERAEFRRAALVTEPVAGVLGCKTLVEASRAFRATAAHLRQVADEALALPEPAGGLRTVELPKLPHHTPAQRDVALSRAVRHVRAILLAAGLPPLDALAVTKFWLDDALERVDVPAITLGAYAKAFLRSLPGENALLPTAVTQLEALGNDDPILRLLRPGWLPEVADPSAWGLQSRAGGLRAGDRIVGMEVVRPGTPALLHPWIGEGPDSSYLRPVAPREVMPYRFVALRRDDAGVWRRHAVEGGKFGAVYETTKERGRSVLVVQLTQLEPDFATRFPQEVVRAKPDAVVLDLRSATAAAELVTEAFVGLFIENSVWGFVEAKNGKFAERRSIGLKPSWTGPLVVLVGPNTRGAAETLALGLQRLGRAVVVGAAKTSGRTGAAFATKIDENRQLLVTFGKRFGPDGKPLDGVGVVPDVFVDAPAPRVVPRTGLGEPILAVTPKDPAWKPVATRALASSRLAVLRKIATEQRRNSQDPVGAAAVAIAAAMTREEAQR